MIIEAAQLPEKDKVYMKKDIFGWRVVQPLRKDGSSLNIKNIFDGNTIWINLLIGGWRNFIFLLIILALLSFQMYSYDHDVQAIQDNYKVIASDPIGWCHEICENPQSAYEFNVLNISLDE